MIKPKCLETRKGDGVTYRTYRKPNGRRIRTVEIPLSVFQHQRFRLQPEIDAWHRGEAARDRLAQVVKLAAEGNKQDYIAEVVGTSQQYVTKALKNQRARAA